MGPLVEILDAAFQQWEAPLARGLQWMQERGELAAEADPARLATTVIAALQGGMLFARVRGDITPLRDAIDGAVAELHRWESKASRPRQRASASARKPRPR